MFFLKGEFEPVEVSYDNSNPNELPLGLLLSPTSKPR